MADNQPITERQRIFISLRTRLDSLENLALRYCLADGDDANTRFNFTENSIADLIGTLKDKLRNAETPKALHILKSGERASAEMSGDGECGPGLYPCGEDCLPYPCPN